MRKEFNVLWFLFIYLFLVSGMDQKACAQTPIDYKEPSELSQSAGLQKMFQSSTNESTPKRTIAGDFNTILKGTGYIIKKPFSWDKQNLLTFGIWSLATLGAVFIDEEVNEFFQKNKSETGDKIEKIGYSYGSPYFTLPLSLLVYTTGAVFDQENVRDTGLMMSEILILVGTIQQPLRIIVGRARPYANEGNLSFHPFSIEDKYASFISGHCFIAVGISTILAKQINNNWATALFASLGLCTVLSRMYAEKHWLSDVVMGSAMGYYSAISIVDWYSEKKQHALGGGRLLIYPYYTGLGVSYQF